MRKLMAVVLVSAFLLTVLQPVSASIYEEVGNYADEFASSIGWFLNGERINCYVYNDGKISEVFFLRVISSEIIECGYNNNPTMEVVIFDGDAVEEILESQDLYGLCNAVNKNWIQFEGHTLTSKMKIRMIKTYCWFYVR